MLRIPSYVPEFSWQLFAACDLDADDRLDLIEAQSCIIMLAAEDARAAFRRMDGDADGFLYWPEFDQIYRNATTDGDGLYLHPSRIALLDDLPGLEPSAESRALPANEIMASYDSNRDGTLDPNEVIALLNNFGLDPKLAERHKAMDTDGSGALDLNELETILQFIKLPTASTFELLPESAGSAPLQFDRDRDGLVDLSELQRALLVMAPTLIPWAETIILQADRDGDSRLSFLEIQQAAGQ